MARPETHAIEKAIRRGMLRGLAIFLFPIGVLMLPFMFAFHWALIGPDDAHEYASNVWNMMIDGIKGTDIDG